jgi:molecular chaperone DnaK (HSP70)
MCKVIWFDCRYNLELSELNSFTEKKAEMENQLKYSKNLREKKEVEFKETINNLERKVLHDKNRMKREMLQKLNEAVASFRRVADQQMAGNL